MEFLNTLLIIFGFFAVSFALINIRYILTGREFRGTCSTNNPFLKDNFGDCSVCGRSPDEACKMPELEQKGV